MKQKSVYTSEKNKKFFENEQLFVQNKSYSVEPHCFNMDILEKIKNYKSIILEIGSGNGHFLRSLNESNKDDSVAIVGIEIAKKHYNITLNKNKNYKNCFVLYGNAEDYLGFFQEHSVKQIHINFPDPWYKKKHNNRILCKSSFLEQLSLLLKPDGFISIVTDVFELCLRILSYSERVKSLHNVYLPVGFKNNLSFDNTSFYRKAKKHNLNIYFLKFFNAIK